MKLSIVDHLLGSLKFYQQNFKTFWKYLWLPMLLNLAGAMLIGKDMTLETMLTRQNHTPLLATLCSISFSLLSSILMTRVLVLWMRGISPSGFWGFPWGKKDLQFILRSIGLPLIFMAVSATIIFLGVILIASFSSFIAIKTGVLVASGIGGGLLIIALVIRCFFYPMSAYGEVPLTLRQSWRLMDKNVIKMSGFFLLFNTISGAVPFLCSSYFYSLYPLFHFAFTPISSIFFIAIFLTLSKHQNIMVLKRTT
jgi:hypothetical protein